MLVMMTVGHQLYSQSRYTAYKWEDNPKFVTPEDQGDTPLYVIYIGDHYQYDYEDGNFIVYKTTHRVYKVQNAEALERVNRIYIPLRSTLDLMAVQARAIAPNGAVTLLDENNIKELEEEDSGYKIFAIEGAQSGGEIEYFYTQKMSGGVFGVEQFQYNYPILEYEFSMSMPENLEYEFRVRNDDGKVVQTDTTDTENTYRFSTNKVPALYSESFSAYDASLKRIDFKLAYNSASGKKRMNTWGEAGMRVFSQLTIQDKDEAKAVAAIIKETKQAEGSGLKGMKAAEHYIKTNFYFDDEIGPNADRIDFIAKNKFGSARGFTRLFVAMAGYFGLDYEVVLSCDRFKANFDPDFDSWSYLDDFMIYFPTEGKYLSPTSFSFRVGTIPSSLITNYGLFIRPEKVQDFIHPVSRTDQIPEPDYKSNFDNMFIDVSFTDDLSANQIHLKRSFLGYSAQYYKAAELYLEEERKKEMLEEVVKFLALDAAIDELVVSEADKTASGWEGPFIVDSDFTTSGYLQNAGSTILLEVGKMIGPQSEMYQENTRQTEVCNQYNRGYYRELNITIPDGFVIENPDDINLKEEVKEGDDVIYVFDATYEISGNVLSIKIDEWYDRVYYPIEKFEEFRKVVNAAADWNKVVLVMKEK